MLKLLDVSQLTPHPLNNYFFDDIEGEKWEEFLSSIQKNGVINPLVVTPKYVIISGSQRTRGCIASGIQKVWCYVCDFGSEDMEILALIESNIRQRGVINFPSVKLGRIINELERIYGIADRKGGPSTGANGTGSPTTKANLREKLGLEKTTVLRSKVLSSMPEPCEELLENGVFSVRTATDVIAKLSPEEQVELFKSLDSTRRYTQKEIQDAIKAAFPKAERIEELEQKLAEYQNSTSSTELELREKLAEITQRERTTYETLMAERRMHKKMINDYEHRLDRSEELLQEAQADNDETAKLHDLIRQYEDERDDLIRDAKIAQNDADLLLIVSAIRSVSDALNEASCDPSELCGDLATTALASVKHLEDILERLKTRLVPSANPYVA